MRIAIVSPFSSGPVRGNLITVQRIASALKAAGQETVVLPVDAMDEAEIEHCLTDFAPDAILAFHAYYCGEIACRQARRLQIPCVVTITGSDINEPKFRDNNRMQAAMSMADAVVCFDESVVSQLKNCFQSPGSRIVVIPQGVQSLPLSKLLDSRIPDDAFVILLPAAFRPVKNIELPLRVLTSLAVQNPQLMFVIAGGVIDREYADRISELLVTAPFALWLGEIPHGQMGAWYARADIVLNCSLYEGMPNSLLEAMALARPVIVADIPGNRSLVRDRETGWLYKDEAELATLIQELVKDPVLRSDMGRRAREFVLSGFSSQDEALHYIKLFTSLGTMCPA